MAPEIPMTRSPEIVYGGQDGRYGFPSQARFQYSSTGSPCFFKVGRQTAKSFDRGTEIRIILSLAVSYLRIP